MQNAILTYVYKVLEKRLDICSKNLRRMNNFTTNFPNKYFLKT